MLPQKLDGGGSLYLWLPITHSVKKVVSALNGVGWSAESSVGGALEVQFHTDRLTEVLETLRGVMSPLEIADTQALFKPTGGELEIGDFGRVRGLSYLMALNQAGWLIDLLAEGRLTSHFQPIVSAGNPAEIFGQECLLRGVDPSGGLIPPYKLFDGARSADMLFQLDQAARRTHVREAHGHGIRSKLFINFTPTSIYDPTFCLQSTVRTIDAAGIAHENVVFEVIETERVVDVTHLQGILNYYREAGFGVALDDMGEGYSSLNMVHQLRPDYVKLDIGLIRGVDSDPYKALIAEKLLEIADRLGIASVAEGVETPEELVWLQEHGAKYVQGYLIARPGAAPVMQLDAPRAPAPARPQ